MTTFALPRLLIRFTLAAAVASGTAACGDADEPPAVQQDDLFDAAPLFPNPQGSVTRYPIVLAHGFSASSQLFSFRDGPTVLRGDGQQVYAATVPPFNAVKDRAHVLAREIDKALAQFGAEKVNIIAHSMGGLDAREVISTLGYGDRVASVTTISTPHRGTNFADVGLALVPGDADDALNALASILGSAWNELAHDSDARAAIMDLAETNADEFEKNHPDDPNVYYQSWAGVSSVGGIPGPWDGEACEGKLRRHALRADSMNPLFIPAAVFTAHGSDLLSNDGVVTVDSAKYGTFRGCIPADHADEVGYTGLDRRTGFNYRDFLRTVAFDLAEMGF